MSNEAAKLEALENLLEGIKLLVKDHVSKGKGVSFEGVAALLNKWRENAGIPNPRTTHYLVADIAKSCCITLQPKNNMTEEEFITMARQTLEEYARDDSGHDQTLQLVAQTALNMINVLPPDQRTVAVYAEAVQGFIKALRIEQESTDEYAQQVLDQYLLNTNAQMDELRGRLS